MENLFKAGDYENVIGPLLEVYGEKEGITRESHKNGNVRYRLKSAKNTPGVWISDFKVFYKLMNNIVRRNYEIVHKDVLVN